jgi:hypothetical protein
LLPSKGIVILPGITSSLTRNPPEAFHPLTAYSPLHDINSDSVGNYQLIDEESTGRMVFRQELPAQGREIQPRNRIPTGITSSWVLIQTGRIKMRKKSSKQYRFQDQHLQLLYNTKVNFKKIQIQKRH